MKRKSIFGAAALFALSCTAFAHDSEPQVDPTPDSAAMRYCMTVGVRAAWGAQARFLGAPANFKYVAEGPLKKMFWGDAKEIPTDAIYVLDGAQPRSTPELRGKRILRLEASRPVGARRARTAGLRGAGGGLLPGLQRVAGRRAARAVARAGSGRLSGGAARRGDRV